MVQCREGKKNKTQYKKRNKNKTKCPPGDVDHLSCVVCAYLRRSCPRPRPASVTAHYSTAALVPAAPVHCVAQHSSILPWGDLPAQPRAARTAALCWSECATTPASPPECHAPCSVHKDHLKNQTAVLKAWVKRMKQANCLQKPIKFFTFKKKATDTEK